MIIVDLFKDLKFFFFAIFINEISLAFIDLLIELLLIDEVLL